MAAVSDVSIFIAKRLSVKALLVILEGSWLPVADDVPFVGESWGTDHPDPWLRSAHRETLRSARARRMGVGSEADIVVLKSGTVYRIVSIVLRITFCQERLTGFICG